MLTDNEQLLTSLRLALSDFMGSGYAAHRERIFNLKSASLNNAAARKRADLYNKNKPAVQEKPLIVAMAGAAVTVGGGKTYEIIVIIEQAANDNLPIYVSCQNLSLVRELLADIKKKAPHVKAMAYIGRQPPPDEDGLFSENHPGMKHVCWNIEAVNEAGQKNHRPAQSVCKTCMHGMRSELDRDKESAKKWFAERGVKPESVEPCRWLYDALPEMLEAKILIGTPQAFSEAIGTWQRWEKGEVIESIQRFIIVDEGIETGTTIHITPGALAGWRKSLPALGERLKFILAYLVKTGQDDSDEFKKTTRLLELIPEIDQMFKQCGADVALDLQPSFDIPALWKKIKAAGGAMGGTAKWERVGANADDAGFYIPLRGLGLLAENVLNKQLVVGKGHWNVYQTSPLIEWAFKRGSTLFVDATMLLDMRALINAAGGTIHEARIKENVYTTMFTGFLYARGRIKNKKGEFNVNYPRFAKTMFKELLRISDGLENGGAILTHKAYLKYSVMAFLSKDAAAIAARDFLLATRGRVEIGWAGKDSRGHNRWKHKDIAQVGMTLLHPDVVRSQYAQTRAVLAINGIEWPAWDGAFDSGEDNHGVPMPVEPNARAWLLDKYAAETAQIRGRARAVSSKRQIQNQIWGGLQSPEYLEALARHGVMVDEFRENKLHRFEKGRPATNIDAIDEAIDALMAVGAQVSRRAVLRYLAANNYKASASAIDARLDGRRATGELPVASKGGPSKTTGTECKRDIHLHSVPVGTEQNHNGFATVNQAALPRPDSSKKNRTPAPPAAARTKPAGRQHTVGFARGQSLAGIRIVGHIVPDWAVGMMAVIGELRAWERQAGDRRQAL